MCGTLQILLEYFSKRLKEKLGKHMYNIQHQYSKLRELKENLRKEEIIVQIGLAEINLCKYTSEIQAVHFGDSHKQVTLHTCVDIPQMIQFHFTH